MAIGVDAITLLGELSKLQREWYKDNELHESFHYFGEKINRMFPRNNRVKIESGQARWQVKSAAGRPVYVDRDITTIARAGQRGRYHKVVARYSETAANNDFSVYKAQTRVSLYDLERGASNPQQFLENALQEVVKDLNSDAAYTMAQYRMLDSTAKLGDVNGTPVQNDARLVADGTATPDAGTGVRFKVDGGSIANFQPGMLVDVYTTTTKDLEALYVTDVNIEDNSVGFVPTGHTIYAAGDTGSATQYDYTPVYSGAYTNADTKFGQIADNDSLYRHSGYNTGAISISEWMNEPAASGDTFFQDEDGNDYDRADPKNYWLLPQRLRTNETARPFSRRDLDDLAVHMGYIREAFSADDGYVGMTTPEIYQRFLDENEDRAIILAPTAEQAPYLARYGFDGIPCYVHPVFGKISLNSDALAPPNKFRLLRPGSWSTIFARDWSPIPTENALGGFYRTTGSSGDRELEYAQDWSGHYLDICEMPHLNAQIENVTG